MSREIKFRAKRIDNGRWVYGFLFKTPLTAENFEADFFSSGVERWCIADKDGAVSEIDIETVGQYTGLKDKNGKEIYEGDVVRVWMGHIDFDDPECINDSTEHVIEYCAESSDYPAFELSPRVDCECNGISFYLCEGDAHIGVIGNIHESEATE